MVWEETLFEEFLDRHLEYPNKTILAFLNLDVTLMLAAKFQFSPTYGSRDVFAINS